MALAATASTLLALAALPARATYGARTTADEPQYLLTALSLAEDKSLDISDELRDERWRAFHEADLPRQTEPLASGRELSPHDPLLPVLLAVPVGLAGWAGAKVSLAVVAGALAALLLWTAHRRFDVPVGLALVAVGAFTVTAPLAVYGAQVYPELPAALLLTAAVAAASGPLDVRGVGALGVAIAVLPWLAVKYVPVAAALAAVGIVTLWCRGQRRRAGALAIGLGAAGVLFLAAHRVVYGGWTVYATGDQFINGEFTVVGVDPDYAGRSVRLLGLLTDRAYGLVAWAPAYLLAVPALAALVRRRPAGWAVLAAPLAAGWFTATFVALTMHGYWWPGRQVVVVLPTAVLAVAWWLAHCRDRVAAFGMRALVALTAAGLLLWGWVLADVLELRRRLIIDFDDNGNPLYRLWSTFLPDYRHPSTATWVRHGVWLAAVAGLAVAGWRSMTDNREREAT
jgi:hypothetical protein